MNPLKPLPLPDKPKFLKAALALATLWLALSFVVPAFGPPLSNASWVFLAQFFTVNLLLLAHATRGDGLAYRAWTVLQFFYTLAAFNLVGEPEAPVAGPALNTFLGALTVLTCLALLYPLTSRWFTEVRRLREASSKPEQMANARTLARMSLIWGAISPLSLFVTGRVEDPSLGLVLALSIATAVVGFVMMVVTSRRIFRLHRELT